MKDIGDHPERAKNLHFSFVVLLRAVSKANSEGATVGFFQVVIHIEVKKDQKGLPGCYMLEIRNC